MFLSDWNMFQQSKLKKSVEQILWPGKPEQQRSIEKKIRIEKKDLKRTANKEEKEI